MQYFLRSLFFENNSHRVITQQPANENSSSFKTNHEARFVCTWDMNHRVYSIIQSHALALALASASVQESDVHKRERV